METIREFLKNRLVNKGGERLVEEIKKKVKDEIGVYPFYFVLAAMRRVNGDSEPFEFRKDKCKAQENKGEAYSYTNASAFFSRFYDNRGVHQGSKLESIYLILSEDYGYNGDTSFQSYLDYLDGLPYSWESGASAFLDHYLEILKNSPELFHLGNGKKMDPIIKATEILRRSCDIKIREETKNLLKDSDDIKEAIKGLIRKGECRQIIFTGAPGTGKTYIAKEIAEIGEKIPGSDQKYEFVQFHPSYDYTDFVEGIRPVEKGDAVGFRKVDGIFKNFCRKVVKANKGKDDGEKLYFFIIDEINRANLSKVFGELMYCLEKDKRGVAGRIQTQYNNLKTYDSEGKSIEKDVFDEGFYIPKNVVIIGTMNDIDRSVESMDFALRRRFEWKEFKVTGETLEAAFMTGSFGKAVRENATQLAKDIHKLNQTMTGVGSTFGLTEQHYISQGQFANLPKILNTNGLLSEIKEYAWKYRIMPLLKEYLRGEDAKTIDDFLEAVRKAFGV